MLLVWCSFSSVHSQDLTTFLSLLCQSLSDQKNRVNSISEKLKKSIPPAAVSNMAGQQVNDSMASLVAGLADRMSFSDSSSMNAIVNILSELGPSCTRSPTALREVLADIARTNGVLDEAAMASLIYFFSDKTGDTASSDAAGSSLSSALLGSIVVGRGGPEGSSSAASGWSLETVAQVISEDYSSSLDWGSVPKHWDNFDFKMRDTNHFRALLELFRAGAKAAPPLSAFTSTWRNSAGQLSLIEAMVSVPPSVFRVPLNEEELADASTAPPLGQNSAPNPECWASMDILQRLLVLSEAPSLYRRVRDLFVRCLLSCPEVLFCALVRLQLHMANSSNQPGGESLVNAGMQMKTELMRELIPLFFRPNTHRRVQNGPAALRRLHAISPTTVMAACFEAWRSASMESARIRLAGVIHIINIAKLLPSPADAVASLLSGNKDAEYSISIAFVMADNDYLELRPWLGEKLSSRNSVATFAVSLVSYLQKTYEFAGTRQRGSSDAPLVSLENILVSFQLLQGLDTSILSRQVSGSTTLGDSIRSLVDSCVSLYPSLRSNMPASANLSGAAGQSASSSEDVENIATQYFQNIYRSEQSIGDAVEMLRQFKTSGKSKENEVFRCMVHNLFNEYRFFHRYPERELRITGILFGALIQEQLVSSITLGIALRYVLEALRKPPSSPGVSTGSGTMFKFGMFALEQFKGRLHEWPQYCSHIVQIQHLREGYADLVAEIEHEMNIGHNRTASSASSVTSQSSGGSQSRDASSAGGLSAQPHQVQGSADPQRVARFGIGLGRAVTDIVDEEREYEAPTDVVLDRVQFLVNNLAPSNVERKATELREILDARYFGWLGHFLVVKRISTHDNFHSLYLSFLDSLGDYGQGLVEAILSSVYHNIGKLLRSPKITTSSAERKYLKNLGIFLGQITLSRNRPILQIMLDCKELLLQGYETGKLIAVAPFLAKILEGAKSSVIFRPPNPWLMGILGVFHAVYNVQGLKMNIKFEVEVLCNKLNMRLKDIPLRNDVLSRRVAPVKEGNPDFYIKTPPQRTGSSGQVSSSRNSVGSPESSAVGVPSGSDENASVDQQETVIPNLASYVTVNSSLPQMIQSQGGAALASTITAASLKRWVPIAVDRAIREIIQPVVERSVTIACITTKEIVTKDFAMESDETKMRKAGQLMVANLAGSLALVTCREPLRSSVSSHLRQLLTSNIGQSENLGEQEQNAIEQCVQVCSTDNLELGCRLIEKAATEKAVRDVDDALAAATNARRTHREQTGQPFFDTSIFSGGNQRYPAALPDPLRPKPGGLRSEHFQLYESFQRIPRQGSGAVPAAPSPGLSPRVLTTDSSNETGADAGMAQRQPQFSTERLASVVAKLDSVVTTLLSAAGSRASEIKLAMLPPDHQIRHLLGAVKQVLSNYRPLTASEQDMVLRFSQGVFKRLYELSLSEPLRIEVLVSVLENINDSCPKLGKVLGIWATYAPIDNEAQRRLHKTVLLLLVRSRLQAVHDLDNFLATEADNGRNHIWVEFSLLFIRTALMERIATPSDFPKLLDLMKRITDGRSQASQQVLQDYRTPILHMLEETRAASAGRGQAPVGVSSVPTEVVSVEQNSSLTAECLRKLAASPNIICEETSAFAAKDPANARQQIASLLEGWFKLQSDSLAGDKTVEQYMRVLQQFGLGKSEEQSERFFRLSTLTIVDAVLKTGVPDEKGPASLNYSYVDKFAALLKVIFLKMNGGGSTDQISAQRLGVLNRILGVIVRSMVWHYERWRTANAAKPWDQRPWYRLFMNLAVEINKPDPALDSIRLGILSVFGAAFHCCQPLALPGAYLSMVSFSRYQFCTSNVFCVCPLNRVRIFVARTRIPSTLSSECFAGPGTERLAYLA